MKKRLPYIFLSLIFLFGLGLLLYPSFSDYWNSLHQSRAILDYSERVSGLTEEEYNALRQQAEAYNASIFNRLNPMTLQDTDRAAYEQALDVGQNGIMGYIEIPSISCNLPIYHGTGEDVLQTAIGHLDWTSLPIGGESTHAVLSGHRGLPSARLFTDLDRLAVGDQFYIYVLNDMLTYEVDQILIVEPMELSPLQVVPGEDYCTLVTCTPYGINTHRMLVRGHRVPNTVGVDAARVTAEATQIEPIVVAPVVAVPFLVLFIIWLVRDDRSLRDDDMESTRKEITRKRS